MNLQAAASREAKLVGGHRLCPGCGLGAIVKQVLASTDHPIIVVNATGCLEICTSAFPQTSWNTPWIHSLFENTAAVASGIAAAKKAFERKNKLSGKAKDVKIVAFAGDGGTYDIGLQALSGALERGHDFAFICLDNEGYMNTGYQRSSASPLGAATSTSPAGKILGGKQTNRKDILAIVAAHRIPFAAQTTAAHHLDLLAKAKRAIETPGPTFLNIFSPCPTNWKTPTALGMEICKKAVETNFWPLVEVVNGKWKLNSQPAERKPIEEFLANQKRFKHLLKPENSELKNDLQKEVDERFAEICKLATLG
ncbi:MAG: thiamine pyrophosphate-dependent enzyme [Patescibacteria group bacterium]